MGRVKKGLTKTPARGAAERTDAPWRPAELQRRYRALLDSAKEAPQTILDSDGSMLVVETKERADFEHRLTEHLALAAQFQAAWAAHRGEEPATWAAQTPFPWIASLGDEEVEEFAHELLAYTLDAGQRGTLDSLEGNLAAWRSTAVIYEQPAQLAKLTASIDPAKLEEVFPPSEEQAEAVEA